MILLSNLGTAKSSRGMAKSRAREIVRETSLGLARRGLHREEIAQWKA